MNSDAFKQPAIGIRQHTDASPSVNSEKKSQLTVGSDEGPKMHLRKIAKEDEAELANRNAQVIRWLMDENVNYVLKTCVLSNSKY